VKKTVVLLNRQGGAASRDPDIGATVAAALERAGVAADVELIDGGECAVRCRAAAKRGDHMIIVGGGDGTISAAAAELADAGTRLGILPLGTLNHFAKDLNLPISIDDAVGVIATGETRCVDVGEVNGHIFINNSSIGIYPYLVLDRERKQRRQGLSKWPAMAAAGSERLLIFQSRPLRILTEAGSR